MKKKCLPGIIAVLLLLGLIPGFGALAEGALVSSDVKEIAAAEAFGYQLNFTTLSEDFRANPFTVKIAGDQINSVTVGGVAATYDEAAGAFTVNSTALGDGDAVAVSVTFAAEATGAHAVTTTVTNGNVETYSGALTVTIQGAEQPPAGEGGENGETTEPEMPLIDGGGFGGYGGGGTAASSTVYQGSANNYLKSLAVKGSALDPAFHKTDDTYFISVSAATTALTVNATAEEKKAVAVVTGNTDLKPGLNKILISVTAENDDVRYYRIYVTREEN